MLNFVGAFLSLKVAATIGQDIVDTDEITMTVVFAALIGAIAWNLATWYFGLPSSSSHALIGGLIGAMIAANGTSSILVGGLVGKVIVPALTSPIVAFVVAAGGILLIYRIVGRLRPGLVGRGFRGGQLLSGGLLALSHGTNDAQKTMGVITLALVAHGNISPDHFYVPQWVVVLVGDGDRARHLHRRLADHPHDGQPDHQDGSGPGVRGPERRRERDPRRVARRLPAVDDARDLRRRHGRRGGQAAVGGALGRGRQHGHRVAADAALCRADRRAVYGVTDLFGDGATGPVVVSAAILVGVVALLAAPVARDGAASRRRHDRVS